MVTTNNKTLMLMLKSPRTMMQRCVIMTFYCVDCLLTRFTSTWHRLVICSIYVKFLYLIWFIPQYIYHTIATTTDHDNLIRWSNMQSLLGSSLFDDHLFKTSLKIPKG